MLFPGTLDLFGGDETHIVPNNVWVIQLKHQLKDNG